MPTPKDILRKLARRANGYYNMVLPNRVRPSERHKLHGVPGEWISTLSEEEREILKDLKSDDIKDDRLEKVIEYICYY